MSLNLLLLAIPCYSLLTTHYSLLFIKNIMIRKKLIAGNWKMNKTSSEAADLVSAIVAQVGKANDVDVVVCPPFTLSLIHI